MEVVITANSYHSLHFAIITLLTIALHILAAFPILKIRKLRHRDRILETIKAAMPIRPMRTQLWNPRGKPENRFVSYGLGNGRSPTPQEVICFLFCFVFKKNLCLKSDPSGWRRPKKT